MFVDTFVEGRYRRDRELPEWNNTKIKVAWENDEREDRKDFNGPDVIDFFNRWVNLELAARLRFSGYKIPSQGQTVSIKMLVSC